MSATPTDWGLYQAYAALLVSALVPIIAGSHSSLKLSRASKQQLRTLRREARDAKRRNGVQVVDGDEDDDEEDEQEIERLTVRPKKKLTICMLTHHTPGFGCIYVPYNWRLCPHVALFRFQILGQEIDKSNLGRIFYAHGCLWTGEDDV